MRFLLERGADIQHPDSYGVTPLHVAAALDYEDMIYFLLERKGTRVCESKTAKSERDRGRFADKELNF